MEEVLAWVVLIPIVLLSMLASLAPLAMVLTLLFKRDK